MPTAREALQTRCRGLRYQILNEKSSPKLLQLARDAAEVLAAVETELESPAADDPAFLMAIAELFHANPLIEQSKRVGRDFYTNDTKLHDQVMHTLRRLFRYP